MRRLMVSVTVLLCGCGGIVDTPAARVARAEKLIPADARLAEIYRGSCYVCHTSLEAKAPLTGDASDWEPRLAKGMPALLQSAIAGYNGMPAGGQCFECTEADHEALIRFMAKGEGAASAK